MLIAGSLFYYVARVLGDSYDKKPLKYVETKKVESNKIENNKNMENKEDIQQTTSTNKRWYAPYIVAGLIIAGAQGFIRNYGGEFIILVFAIAAGFFYYPLKSKINIKNNIARIVITFLILEIIAGLFSGISVGLINGLIGKGANQKRIAECKTICDFAPATKVWTIPFHNSNGQFVPAKHFQTQEQCIDYCLTQ